MSTQEVFTMANTLEMRYGSCRNMPEALLQPGSGGKYPKWFIDFLRGACPRDAKLDRTARAFLLALCDGKWHKRLPKKVGVWTMEACVELGLVRERVEKAPGKDSDSYWTKFKITDLGKKVLGRDKLLLYSLAVN
ncbi:MAG: hypothetical protein WCF77_00240 [Minisyncoccia bacterium]